MQFVPLIAGSNLRFLWRVAPGLLLLALLLSMAGLISFAIRARKHMKSLTPEPPRPQLITGQTVTTAQEIRRIVIAVLITASVTGPGGWLWRNYQLTANRYHYENVWVERTDDSHFTLYPAWMKPFAMTTCTPQNWQTGEKMINLHFQWTSPCDHVDGRGEFYFYMKNGKRLIFPKEDVTNVRFREEAASR